MIAIDLGSVTTLVIFGLVLIFMKNMWIALTMALFWIFMWHWVGVILMKHPFTDILEGKGMLAIDFNSTGIIRTFTVNIDRNMLSGKLGNKVVNAQYLRENIKYFQQPVVVDDKDCIGYNEKGDIVITLPIEKYLQTKFRFESVPTFLYNSITQTPITKEWFSGKEKEVYTENNLSYLHRIIEELNVNTHNAVRYVMEMLRPKSDFLKKNLVWIIIIIAVLILGAMFAPKLLSLIQGKGSEAVSSTTGTPVTPPVTPRG
jgi:hypothetical protein